MSKAKNLILYGSLTVVGFYFLFTSLIESKNVLAPIFIALLIAMLMLPVANKLEKITSRLVSSTLSVALVVIFYLTLLTVVGVQVKQFSDKWPELKEQLKPKIEALSNSIVSSTGISEQQLKNRIPNLITKEKENKEEKKNTTEPQGLTIQDAMTSTFNFLANNVLIYIYLFFFLLYRKKFKDAMLSFVPDKNCHTVSEIVSKSIQIAQKYLFGKFIIIVFLTLIYSIGLIILGIENAIIIALISAILSLVPYVGNAIGGGLALFAGVVSGGDLYIILGIVIIYTLAQLIENNFLQPFIVGKEVELNPAITIIGVVVGSSVWGLTGSIIAIPYIGIMKVACERIDVLKPISNLLGDDGNPSKLSDWNKKVKKFFRKTFNKDDE